MARQYALDTETTGLSSKDGDRIIELAIVEITRDPNPRTYHQYFDPEDREISPEATNVHGLTNDMLKGKPLFRDCIFDILDFLEDDAELVIHNAPFDLAFLRDEFILADQLWPELSVVDTLKEAIRQFPNSRHSLDALCSRFKIDLSSRSKHGGLIDTKLLAQLYLAWFGQAGFDLATSNTVAKEVDLSSLGPLNLAIVPLNEAEVVKDPPSKSWVPFLAALKH